MSAQLEPDRDQMERFVNALFMHAGEGGTVSLRAFFDDELAKKRKERAYKIRPVRLNGDGLRAGHRPGGLQARPVEALEEANPGDGGLPTCRDLPERQGRREERPRRAGPSGRDGPTRR